MTHQPDRNRGTDYNRRDVVDEIARAPPGLSGRRLTDEVGKIGQTSSAAGIDIAKKNGGPLGIERP